MRIKDKTNAPHYTWGNNCDSWVLNDGMGLSVKQELMPQGTKEQLHYHKEASQFFFIIKGIAVFYIDNIKYTVSQHQGITIQPGEKHFIANETDDVLEFLVISQPSTNNDRITL